MPWRRKFEIGLPAAAISPVFGDAADSLLEQTILAQFASRRLSR